MVEQDERKLAAYGNIVKRSQMASFYASFGDRYKSLTYVSELASTVARSDAEALGLSKQECEKAWKAGFGSGEWNAANTETEEIDLPYLDTQERQLTELLEETLNLKAAPVRY